MFRKNPGTVESMERFHSYEEQRAFLGCYYFLSVYVKPCGQLGQKPGTVR